MKKQTVFITVLIILIVAITIFLISPFRFEKAESRKFTPYISAYTSGVVSKQSAIRVMLVGESRLARKDEAIKKKLFTFQPKIKGSAYWIDERTLEYRPEEPLPSGTSYEGTFKLKEVMKIPKELGDFHFSFQTITQSYETENKGIRAYNSRELEYQQLIGQVRTADFARAPNVEKMLEATQEGDELMITWQHNSDGKLHKFVIDSVRRKEKPTRVKLKWNGDPIQAKDDFEKEISIPSLSDFDIMQVNVNHQPEQFVSLIFSDPIDEQQDLEGLIRIESSEVRFSIDGNEVKIFPAANLTNHKKLVVEPSVQNSLGYELGKRWSSTLSFQSIKPKVEFLGDGNILPGSDGLILPFKAVNLSAVNVRIIKIFEDNIVQFFQENHYGGDKELKRVGRIVYQEDIDLGSQRPVDLGNWNTFSLDLARMIEAEPGAIYRVQINFRKEQSLYPCGENEKAEEDASLQTYNEEIGNESDIRYWHYRGYDYYDYNDGYNWREREDPCKRSYYLRYRQAISKNVLASDLGIIAKRGKLGEMLFAVTDLKTTEPVSNVALKIYNFQQQQIALEETDEKGMARIAYENSKPFFVVAQKSDQYGYLRVDDGSSLSLSKFNVAGRETQNGLKGFIYGERDVWRPGDSIYLAFMLYDEQQKIPEKHPVLLELINPRNQLVTKKVATEGLDGLYTFRLKTDAEAPTGTWKARVKVGGAIFTRDLKIETIKPNRLKMDLDFATERFSAANPTPQGTLQVEWLHGATAGNLKAEVKMKLAEANTRFEDFPGYTFEDPSRTFSSYYKTIFEGRLNEQGKAQIQPDLGIDKKVPGMLSTYFTIKAYEESGNFSITQKVIPYSPFEHYVGLKVPKGKGWHGALSYDEEYTIPIVALNQDGKPVDRDDLRVEVYKVKWRWWWERNQRDNLSRYVGSSSRYLIQEGEVGTQNGKGFYKLTIGEKYWGRIYIRVVDQKSGHSAGKIAYVSYPGWNRDEMPGGATMLSFTTDKDTYEVGEEVVAKLPTAKGGRALVSLENGTRVLKTFWVPTKEKFTEFSFKTTEAMSPNVYVHVSLLQQHNTQLNDLPIRMYGVQPVKVENEASHLHPEVLMPEEIKPMEQVNIRVREKNGQSMNYTVALVDEGLLDITGYNTPDPWGHFYARDALGVKTWDMYDYVMGAYSGEFAGLFEIGGGLDRKARDKKSANRFDPVVKYFGPFHLKRGKTNSHQFVMPNYIGSVKTMVVAKSKSAFGSAEATTPVKKALMVQPTLPRVVGPKEEITIPVTVFAMDEDIQNVRVTLESNSFLEPLGRTTKNITFKKTGDKVVHFRYKVKERLGVAQVQIEAVSGSERASSDTELQVRSPNPRTTRVIDASLKQDEVFTEQIKPVGMEGTNHAVLEVSQLMPLNLEKRLQFLIRYPHGCIEQTTSAVFPQLFLDKLLNLSEDERIDIQNNVRSGINKLRSFQQTSGGFGYWQGSRNVSHWGTNYAGHFMLEAKQAGYDVPQDVIHNWVDYQRRAARNWTENPYYDTYRNTSLVQAYRLYTLALAGEPVKGAMNRMRKMEKLSLQARWRLAAAYELTGKSSVADQIIAGLSTEVKKYHELGYTYGSHIRDRAMILETLNLMEEEELATKVMMELGKALGSARWYSTQTTAYALMAVSKYIGANNPDEPIVFEYKTDQNSWKTVRTQKPISQIHLPIDRTQSLSVEVRNKGKNMIFSRIVQDGIPAIGKEVSESNDLDMKVRYTDMEGNSINPRQIDQGTDFRVYVHVRHPGIRGDYEELALTQIFPSGWEIHNFRLDQVSNLADLSDEPEYQDIRDDRVYTYFDLEQGEEKVFVFQLNASYLGRYYLSAVNCEAMYDHSISAQTTGQWVEVVKPGEQ